MRLIATIFLLCACLENGRAQKFVLGVPIYDTIKSWSHNTYPKAAYLCVSAEIGVDTGIVNIVSGVTYHLLITGSTFMKDSLRLMDDRHNDLGPVNVGDSFLLTHNNSIRDWATLVLLFGSRTTGGTFYYAIIAAGTPTSLTDTFFCKEDVRMIGGISIHNCNRFSIRHTCNLATCVVEEPFITLHAGKGKIEPVFQIAPTLVYDILRFRYAFGTGNEGRLLMFDQFGRTMGAIELAGDQRSAEADISSYRPGVYHYRLLINGVVAKTGKFVKL